MTRRYSLKNALEQFQDDLIETDQNSGVNPDTADVSEDAINDDLNESQDLSEDINALATASESLESLAQALDEDLFQSHTASSAEIRSVKMALESYGLEDEAAEVKPTETKGSLKDRIVKGAKAVWDWLVGIGKKISDWVANVFINMTKPLLAYDSRMSYVVKHFGQEEKNVSGEKYVKHLGNEKSAKKLSVAITELADFVDTVATANTFVKVDSLLSEIEKKGHADGGAIVKMLNEMQSNFLKAYPEERDGKYYSRDFIGGNVFMMDIGTESTINWDHAHKQEKVTGAPWSLTHTSVLELQKAVTNGVKAWKDAQSAIANMKLRKVADNINRIGKSYKGELNDQAKAALRVMPKMIKSPAVDAALVMARVLGAAVSFAEAHINVSVKDKLGEAGDSIRGKASDAKSRIKGAFNSKSDKALADASNATNAASKADMLKAAKDRKDAEASSNAKPASAAKAEPKPSKAVNTAKNRQQRRK